MTDESRTANQHPVPSEAPVTRDHRRSDGDHRRSDGDHRRHDEVLVASLLDPDLPAELRSQAAAQVAGCSACAELLADLRAIAAATAALPVPPRRRDFRLTAEDAARLRPRGWRRVIAAFGAPRLAVLRPLGAAAATLGLAGLLLTAIPIGAGLFGPSTASGEREVVGAAGESTTRNPSADQLAPQGGPQLRGQSPEPGLGTSGGRQEAPSTPGGLETGRQGVPTTGGFEGVPLGFLFGALFVVGLAIVGLRLVGERAVGRRAPPG